MECLPHKGLTFPTGVAGDEKIVERRGNIGFAVQYFDCMA